jgi:hypothetical protein
LTEELVDCSGGEEVSLETGTKRKLEALEKVRDGMGGVNSGKSYAVNDYAVAVSIRALYRSWDRLDMRYLVCL